MTLIGERHPVIFARPVPTLSPPVVSTYLDAESACEHPPPPMPMDPQRASPPPFFIFGCERSGTSLLARMLNGHSRLGVPAESFLFSSFVPILPNYGDLSIATQRARLTRDASRVLHAFGWPRSEAEPPIGDPSGGSLAAVVNALLTAWASRHDKQRWGEKTPGHLFYWRQIRDLFPTAFVIHIVRDGRDVALSTLAAPFGPRTVEGVAQRWAAYLAEAARARTLWPPAAWHELRYEDLLEDPAHELATICTFLGERYEGSMLDATDSASASHLDPRNAVNLGRPLLRSNFGKWRSSMDPSDVRRFEATAGRELVRYGYPLSAPPRDLSRGQRLAHLVRTPAAKAAWMLLHPAAALRRWRRRARYVAAVWSSANGWVARLRVLRNSISLT